MPFPCQKNRMQSEHTHAHAVLPDVTNVEPPHFASSPHVLLQHPKCTLSFSFSNDKDDSHCLRALSFSPQLPFPLSSLPQSPFLMIRMIPTAWVSSLSPLNFLFPFLHYHNLMAPSPHAILKHTMHHAPSQTLMK